MSRDPAKRRASKQRYNQSAKGKASKQRRGDKVAAGRAAHKAAREAIAAEKKAAFAQTAREAAVTAVVKLKREQTHAQRAPHKVDTRCRPETA
jgi:hypothetical protein